MVSEPRLADGTIARLWPHENTIWADDAFMAVSFISAWERLLVKRSILMMLPIRY